MKKLYFILYTSFSALGFSQTILTQQESTTRTVQDPNVVVLAPGFHATSTVSNPFIAKIGAATENSGGGPDTPSTAGSTNPSGTTETTTNRFHDTQGNIEVNGGGQLQFTLPIALPPGVKSVAPQINLVYTSGSGNGIAGYGWNISGITAIARMGKTIETDGETKGIQLDYSDYYSFNGQRLILKSGEYGKDGAEYVTEKFSNIKIKSVGALSGLSWQGPEYWEVTFEDGSQAWYGGTGTGSTFARTPMEYNIVKWKDAQGNYITYNYTQSENVAAIRNIQWGKNETVSGSTHFNEVNFNYESRTFNEEAYHQGVKFLQQKILSSVEVSSSLTPFRSYHIEYENNGTGYRLVKNIIEKNSTGISANPITINYTPLPATTQEISYQYSLTNYNTKKYGDFDMDGVTDYIEFVSNGVINYKNSVYLDVPAFNLQYDSSRFTGSDFKDSVPIIVKKDGYVKGIGLAVPVRKNTSVLYKKDIEIQIYSIDIAGKKLNYEYSKLIPFNRIAPSGYEYDEDLCIISGPTIKMVPYDFNGDGLTELVINYSIRSNCPIEEPGGGIVLDNNATVEIDSSYNLPINRLNVDSQEKEGDDNPEMLPGIRTTYTASSLVDLDESISIANSVYRFEDGEGFGLENSFADLNGDGIEDMLYKSNSGIGQVVNIKRDHNYNYSVTPVGNFNNYAFQGMFAKALYGDFNGDRKVDLLIPQGDKNSNWNLYLSDGKTFNKFYINNFIYYSMGQERFNEGAHHTTFESGCSYGSIRYMQYNVGDFDGDGKSDIEVTSVMLRDHLWDAHHDEEFTFTSVAVYSLNKLAGSFNTAIIYNPPVTLSYPFGIIPSNGNIANTNPIQTNSSLNFYRVKYWEKTFNDKVIPFGTLSINRENQQIILVGKPDDCSISNCNYNYVLQYSYPYLPVYSRIKSINQGGIATEILYRELRLDYADINFYKPVKKEVFPYYEMEKTPMSALIYQLRQTLEPGKVLIQDFRYRGLISHYLGKGMIGFRQTARSSWYTDDLFATKTWSGAEIDPLKDGVPIKEWSIKTNDENQIFPTDISENNTQLLSFKSTEYRFDKLLNGSLVDFGTVSPTDKSKVVSATIPIKSISKDFMKDVRSENTITYDVDVAGSTKYYLPVKTVSNINTNFSVSTTNLSYLHNVSGAGNAYFIGRPQNKTDEMQAYGDTKKAKEEYTYENNLLKTKKNWNRDNTGWFLETYTQDGFGNITQQVITSSIDSNSKTDVAEYDTKGRFVVKKTDNLGLITTITYNDWGQILTQTDPLGNILTNEYDNWGKLLKSKSNLGGTTTYAYEKRANLDAVITQYSPDGNQKITYTNKLGQDFKTTTKKFGQNEFVSATVIFDALGRKTSSSEPYSGQYPTKWNTIEYDDYSRPIKATSFTGKEVVTNYNGRTATVTETNANNRFKKQTADPLGNIISSEDMGGVIHFKFNAAGENTEANYEGNIIKTSYDAWGNKVRFEDPSNGVYEYQYSGYFGAISKTISPKGEKTYEYNNKGQLVKQKEKTKTGNGTDKTINFSYNDKGLITQKYGISSGKSFSSGITYDSFGRVLNSYEDSNGKYFMKKGITYDNMMRVISYEKSLYSSGILTKVALENVYDTWNGELSKVKEKGTGKILWELNAVNEKGQVTQAKLGAVNILNTYATNGFLNNVNHTNTAGNTILQIGYSFNAIKNELNSRTTGGDFNILEQFEYDANNRLVNWTDPITGTFTQNQKRNVYDNKGRITGNDQIGTIGFGNTLKKYQATGMVLNAQGTENYANDLLQKITYNENNDPIFIDGVKGDVAFEYGLTSMRQKVTYGGNFAEDAQGKFTKYYSEDGSYEIIKNNQTGQEKHLIYIGGSPYESNIIYLKEFNTSTPKFVFLHKDYLGSVLAITDEAGTKLEQRHFDAWGNLTHLKIGAQATITDKNQIRDYLSAGNLVVDRGYTSHEHFAEVGLIHMNGRLYDPLLRRFLNADENIQDPYNTQNYNKYGYVMNNPLLYNDPSGEFIILGLTPLVSAIILGAAIGLGSYIITAIITGQDISLLGAFKATLFGAFSGAVTFGIGEIFAPALKSAVQMSSGLVKAMAQTGLAVAQAAAHGVAQGALSLMQGGNATMGAISGFAGSLGAAGFGAGMKGIGLSAFANSGAGMVVSGALMGGVGSELVGGNFWQGAVIGGIVAGLNHAMHEMGGPGDGDDPPGKKSIKESLKEKYNETKQKLSEMKEYVEDFYGGVNDFIDTYDEMKTANWKNSDKYFHSKANYKATLRGPGGEAAAIKMSNLREITDQYIKGDSRASSIADQKANLYGRQQAHRRANFTITSENMRFIINKYRPISLPTKY